MFPHRSRGADSRRGGSEAPWRRPKPVAAREEPHSRRLDSGEELLSEFANEESRPEKRRATLGSVPVGNIDSDMARRLIEDDDDDGFGQPVPFTEEAASWTVGGSEPLARFLEASLPGDEALRRIRELFLEPGEEPASGHQGADALGSPTEAPDEAESLHDQLSVFTDRVVEGAKPKELEYDAEFYERALAAATKGLEPAGVKYIWETNIFLQEVVGSGRRAPLMQAPKPKLVPNPPAVADEPRPIVPFAVSDRIPGKSFSGPRRSWLKEIEERRQTAIFSLYELVSENPVASKLGRQLIGLQQEQALIVVHDTVRARATNTIKQRMCSLLQYKRYLMGIRDGPCFPFTEEEAYGYVSHLRTLGAPPTRASRFLEAMRFAHHVLGVAVGEALDSRRVEGAVLASLSRKRMLRQRDPLTAAEVVALEKWIIQHGDDDFFIGNVVGGCLLALHSRSRWGDLVAIPEEPASEGGWFEARSSYHKTYNRPERRHRWLPIAGLSHGVSGLAWFDAWLKLRARSGLQAAPSMPLVPHRDRTGRWLHAKVTSSEATTILRRVLQFLGSDEAAVSNKGTHSLKATLLSWCAKAGVDLQSRRLLGNHISKQDVSVLCYSRDSLSAPMRLMQEVVIMVRQGKFHPDASRSGLFAAQAARDAGAEPDEEVLSRLAGDHMLQNREVAKDPESGERTLDSREGPREVEADDDSLTESGSSDDDTTDDDKATQTLEAGVSSATLRRARAALGDEERVYRHVKHGTFHLGRLDAEHLLACGRPISLTAANGKVTVSYHSVDPGFVVGIPRCRVCFGSADREIQAEEEVETLV